MYAILNGDFVERSQAKVDIEDRGYQFGDGIYEVIRVYNGKMFAAREHLERLNECTNKINIELSLSLMEIESMLNELIEKNQLESGIVYLQVTRGVAIRNHAFPAPDTKASFVAYTKEISRPVEGLKHGVRTLLVEDIRWLHCDIKSLNLLGNLLAKQKAVESGCTEAILHRGELVTEGSSSNISIFKNGILYTHPANQYILNGITRQQLLLICKKNQIPFVEKAVTVEELIEADEIFLSSTTAEVTPIIEISGTSFAAEKPGAMTVRLQNLLEQEIAQQCGTIQ